MSAIASIPTATSPTSWADDSVAIAAARDVSRRHGSGDAAVDALRGVSLALHEGDFVAVMGPSGSGKSTLMHIMAGLDKPTSGSTSIDGIALEGLRERELTKLRRDRVGFVFQAYNLLPTLSAAENVRVRVSPASEGAGRCRPSLVPQDRSKAVPGCRYRSGLVLLREQRAVGQRG